MVTEKQDIGIREVARHHEGRPYTLHYDGDNHQLMWEFQHGDGERYSNHVTIKETIPDTLKGNTMLEKYFEILSISVAATMGKLNAN